jgi:hypothetical protein
LRFNISLRSFCRRFFLAEDYSQYEPSAPFVSHVHVSQATVAALVAQGDLHFTLVIPPGADPRHSHPPASTPHAQA